MLTGTDCAGKRNKPRAAGIRLQRRAGDLAAGRVRLQQQVPPRAGTGKGGGTKQIRLRAGTAGGPSTGVRFQAGGTGGLLGAAGRAGATQSVLPKPAG